MYGFTVVQYLYCVCCQEIYCIVIMSERACVSSYVAQFILSVIKFRKENGNRAPTDVFDVAESNVREWENRMQMQMLVKN